MVYIGEAGQVPYNTSEDVFSLNQSFIHIFIVVHLFKDATDTGVKRSGREADHSP